MIVFDPLKTPLYRRGRKAHVHRKGLDLHHIEELLRSSGKKYPNQKLPRFGGFWFVNPEEMMQRGGIPVPLQAHSKQTDS